MYFEAAGNVKGIFVIVIAGREAEKLCSGTD